MSNLTSNHTTPHNGSSLASMLATLSTEITLSLVIVLFCILGMVGNAMTIFLFCFRIRLNKSTVYILNLAVADLLYLIGCCVVILYFLCLFNGVPTGEKEKVIIATLGDLLNNFTFNAGIFFLGTLALERCLSVCFPIWYRCQRPKNLSAILCSVMWVLSLVVMIMENYIYPQMKVHIALSVVFLILTVVMVGSSVLLLIQIQHSSEACRPVKLYIVVIASVINFLLSLVPARVLKIVYLPTPEMRIMSYILSSLCTVVNSCMNPYIYIIVSRWKRGSSTAKDLEMTFRDDSGQTSQQSLTTASDLEESEEKSGASQPSQTEVTAT